MNVYMVGIGGIGMSALARWFAANGRKVAGYDKTSTALTDALQAEGIPVHFSDEVDMIPHEFRQKESTVVVYTPAVPADHKELNWFKANGFEIMKRSQALGLATEGFFTVAISGTHGKTTTSSMVAHLLYSANRSFIAFLGGVMANYGTNLLMNIVEGQAPIVVVEADEYDRSFLTLNPNITIVTSVEADHLDIYGTLEAIHESFSLFIGKIQEKGQLFLQAGVEAYLLGKAKSSLQVQRYGHHIGDRRAENIKVEGRYTSFDYVWEGGELPINLQVPGMHNVENATAAISVALSLGIPHSMIQEAMASFKGVQRRFEFLAETESQVYIDDYAHHPTEVEAFLKALRGVYPTKRLTVVFQPHLFTRTRDFAEGFAKSLSLADEVILLNIYPARELPLPHVDSQMLLNKITCSSKQLLADVQLLPYLREKRPEVIATIGAGDIDRFRPLISDIVNRE